MNSTMNYTDFATSFSSIVEERFEINNVQPEALFEIGVDAQTRALAEELLMDFRRLIDVGVKHNVNVGASADTNKAIDKSMSFVEMVLDIALTCYGAWAFTTKSRLHGCVASALVAVRFGFIDKLFERVGKDTVQAQSFTKITAAVLGAGVVFKLLDGIMYAASFNECYDFALAAIRRTCNDQNAAALDTFLNFIQNVLDWFSQFLTGKDFPIPIIGKSSVEVRKSLDRINSLTVAKQANIIAHDELINELEREIKLLDKNLKDLPRGSALLSIGSQASVAANRLLVEIRTIVGSASGSRVEPVCYIFVGAPGLGKTMFNNIVCDHFVYELSSEYMRNYYKREPESVHKQIFAFDQTDQYCSGYRNQPVVIIDEIEPLPPAPGIVSTPSRLIRMINSVACPLNMPDLGSKGVTFFNSRVIVGTTNNHNWANLPGVSDRQAFFRRVNFVSTIPDVVALNRDFGSGKLQSFEQLRPAMHDYMRGEYLKYESGEYSLDEFLDSSYKYVHFSVASPNSAGSIVPGSGLTIKPSDLIRRVVQEAKTKAGFAGSRVRLTQRIVQEKSNLEAVEAQSEMFGKVKDLITRRYDLRPTGVNRATIMTSIERHYENNHLDIPSKAQMDKCSCKVCTCFVKGGDFATIALKMTKAVGSPTPNQVECHDIIEDMKNDLNWISTPMRKSFCKVPINGTSEDFVSFYKFLMRMRSEAIFLTLRECDHAMIGAGIGRFATDLAMVIFMVRMASAAYALFKADRKVQGEGDYPLKPKKPVKKPAAITVRVHDVQPEGGPEDLMYSLVKTNVYKFSIKGSSPIINFSSHFTMVQNQLALTPMHTVRGIIAAYDNDKKAVMEIEGCVQPTTDGYRCKRQSIPLCNILRGEGDDIEFIGGITEVCRRFINPQGEVTPTDMCMVTIPVSARSRATAFHAEDFFSKNIDHVERSGCLVTIGDNGGVLVEQAAMYPERNWEAIKCSTSAFSVASPEDAEDETHWFGKNIIKYVANTRVGYCGAPIFMKRNGTYRIVGIHVAGSVRGAWGYGVAVTAEDIERTVKLHMSDSQSVPIERDEVEIVAESAFILSEGEGTKFGHVECFKAKPARVPTRTSLSRSPLYDLVQGPDRAPAVLKTVLRNGVMVNPIEKAQEEYGCVERAPKLWVARMCMENVYRRIMRSSPLAGEKYIPTYEETVCPGEIFPYARSIPRSTSPGYPYCLNTKKKGKFDFFGEGQDYEFSSAAWFALVCEANVVKEKILRKERPLFVNLSFPKDERRSADKIESVKTRLISGGSLLFTLLLRQCTLGFFNFIVRTRGTSGIAIGTNPYSEDWDALANRMGAYPDKLQQANCIAGDFSGFDKKLHYVWTMEFCRIITRFYGDEGSDMAKIRHALFYEIAFSRHIVGNSIVDWVGSNPSGQSMTTPTNSAANAAMLRYALVHEYLERAGMDITEESVAEALDVMFHPQSPVVHDEEFGDDSLIAILDVDDESFSWIDGVSVSEAFERHLSVKYTDESKSDVQQARRPLSECTFLKRGFAQSGVTPSLRGRFMAPLELDSILDSVRWFKPKDDGSGLTEWADNVGHMLEELSLHGPDVYERVGTQIINACASLEQRPPNLPIVLPHIGTAQTMCCSREMEY